MIRFLHTADIHLDSPLRGLEVHEDAPVEKIRGATRRAFDNLIDLAIGEEVDFLLMAGDLYDGDWKDYNTGLFFADRMGRLNRAGIRVFIVSGNHDAASQITRTMPLPDNVTLFPSRKPATVRIDEFAVAIHGQSYSSRAVTENLAANFPPYDPHSFNIGLLHTSLTGREGHEEYAPCTVDDLRSKGYDYWALGHVHKREIVSEDPLIIFPGNLQGRHIKETGVKGATLVTVKDGCVINTEQRDLDVLRWSVCRVDLSECTSTDSIYSAVRHGFERELDLAHGNPLALRLILTGRCGVHTQLLNRTEGWIEEFRGIAAGLGDLWLEKVQFRTERKSNPEEIISGDSAVAGLLQSIKRLDLDSETLLEMVPELAVLKSKLPAEIYNDYHFFDTSPDKMTELQTRVAELLTSRILHHGGTR
ncbi:MAG: DNA repair exonuclease [Deltaproteobacteria bacterium]|nr:DNA repair exonuclease [Deltaproteobacteria bacterium]MBW2658509.1 DNA repair exonuclease [Deltaproteobacteria bacterium]